MSARTAVAMSGGLDSSVVAWMLSREESVVGLSMLLWDRSGEAVHGRCCGALDLGDARRVARQCDIPHYTLRLEEEFRRQVVEPFVDEYLAGRTPIPCTRCNTWIKFDLFLERARALGAGRLATGHYARIVDGPEGPELHRAVDEAKDQSYYLFELTREQLAASRFPLGELSKDETRALAREAGLVVAEKGESMEICFVAGGVRDFVEEQVAERPERFPRAPDPEPARVVDREGRELGRGAPYYRYTVGQRRGLGVATGERLYVIGIDAGRGEVTVGDRDALLAPGLVGEGLRWTGRASGDPGVSDSGAAGSGAPGSGAEIETTVRIRSRHRGIASRVRPLSGGRCEVEFAEPQAGVTPGQAAVFYQGSRVLGGCWIEGAVGGR